MERKTQLISKHTRFQATHRAEPLHRDLPPDKGDLQIPELDLGDLRSCQESPLLTGNSDFFTEANV